ncbi:MAG: ATP-binding protein, partial [Deltaproteobacteria bacterium]
LTGGARTVPRRQQTLRAAIDWSYDLLSDAEKALLARLSVFAGGCTLDAAEHVCVGEGLETHDVLDLLAALGDKSLVLIAEGDGVTRYWLLETVRQYARDRLNQSCENGRSQHAHLAYFLHTAEEAGPQLRGPEQQRWLERLEAEHDNMRSALAWSSEEDGESTGGLRLAGALWFFWLMRGHFREGRDWLSRLLAAAPVSEALHARARALRGRGVFAELEGDYVTARAVYEQSIALCRQSGDRGGLAAALNNLGSVASAQGDVQTALVLWEQSLAIRRELHDVRGTADLLGHLGKAAYNRGDHASARAMWEESLAISRELGDAWGVGFSLSNLGRLALDEGDYASSREMLEASRNFSHESGDKWGYAWSLMDLGDLAYSQHDYSAARALQQECLAIRRDLHNRPSIADSLERLAQIALALTRPSGAARIWGAAERLREELGVPLSADERRRYEGLVASARQILADDEDFNVAWREGRAMTLEQAIAYALRTKDDA